LQKLTLSFCGVTFEGVEPLAELLASPFSNLVELDLRGNDIRSEGLHSLAAAAMTNTKLETLQLADNSIGGSASHEVNRSAIDALGAALAAPEAECRLCRVDLEMNTLAEDDAAALAGYLGEDNKKVVSFKVDSSLPGELFDKLFRAETKGKKGKKSKKKKK
jgi:Ran GTPase-activating protein (RanGAP) involved in mRNA processing and transport